MNALCLLREKLMTGEIAIVPEVREWLHELRRDDPVTLVAISAAIDMLRDNGPAQGRLLVDTVKATTSLNNLKELRPGSAGSTEIRILFVFDPKRRAVFLVAGDKAGNWKKWYSDNIPIAEARYKLYLQDQD
jgi:hypothetical protein